MSCTFSRSPKASGHPPIFTAIGWGDKKRVVTARSFAGVGMPTGGRQQRKTASAARFGVGYGRFTTFSANRSVGSSITWSPILVLALICTMRRMGLAAALSAAWIVSS